MLISLSSLPPYSHALDKLVDCLKAEGLDVTALRNLHLKALNRMNSETRDPSDSEAPTDRFDNKDSNQARSAAAELMAFAQAMIAQ